MVDVDANRARRRDAGMKSAAQDREHRLAAGSASANHPEADHAPEHPAATCRYCAGKGGRYRLVYSRFLGCEPQTHEGPWEKCWACNGSGKLDADALADLGHDRETISGG